MARTTTGTYKKDEESRECVSTLETLRNTFLPLGGDVELLDTRTYFVFACTRGKFLTVQSHVCASYRHCLRLLGMRSPAVQMELFFETTGIIKLIKDVLSRFFD